MQEKMIYFYDTVIFIQLTQHCIGFKIIVHLFLRFRYKSDLLFYVKKFMRDLYDHIGDYYQ